MEEPGQTSSGSFWSSAKIRRQLSEIVEPELERDEDEIIEGAAYELRLGREAYVSGAKGKAILNPGDMVAIAPGQTALLLTDEKLKIPKNVVAFISLKTSVKLPGLINVSGFHVDPGFEGRLVFTVYNAGTETYAFTRGQHMFLIWFADLSDPEEKEHAGKRQRQSTIPAEDISRLTSAGASPARLDERVRRLEIPEKVYAALLLGLLLAAVTFFLGVGQ